VRHLLLPALLLLIAAPAAAGTIRGTPGSDVISGTQRRDVIRAGAGDDFVQAAWGGVDTIRCGGGRDVVTADLADRVAADCEVVARRLSVDLSTDPAGQHETAVEPDSFAWGQTIVAAFQLGRFETGAAATIGWATSTDAGRTWRRGTLPSLTADSAPPGPERSASDPTVAYDAVHATWLIGALTLDQGGTHVMVSRSQDTRAWSPPVTVASGPVLDKDWIACDNGPTSPHRGRCYLAYTDDEQNWTVVQWSDDGGASWSVPVKATSTLVGTQPVVRPDGALVVVAVSFNGDQALTGSIAAVVSTDGGATFTRSTVAALQAHPAGRLRAVSLPSVSIDETGTIYAAWDDCRFRVGCSGNDLVLSTSTDGLAWTAPARISVAPAGSSQEEFLTGLAADPLQPGRLGLVYAYYLPGSCATGTCLVGTGFVSSADGGASWSVPQQLDAVPVRLDWLARTEGGRMLGDYYSTSFAGNRVVPVFTLAIPPLDGRLREAVFAASLPTLPAPGSG
jgi:BNR repeat-like domain/RTX calcium-binding nonapeptide repeat (4 copies)